VLYEFGVPNESILSHKFQNLISATPSTPEQETLVSRPSIEDCQILRKDFLEVLKKYFIEKIRPHEVIRLLYCFVNYNDDILLAELIELVSFFLFFL